MHAGENRGADDGKKRHRFRGTIDRRAPFLPEQKQDGGNECAGVSDTDPKNEVGDVPRPADRMIQPPGANASRYLVAEAKKTEGGGACGDGKSNPPPAWRRIFNNARNSLR